MGFLDTLCGDRQSDLRIKDPSRVNFDAKKIVSDIATVIANIWRMEKIGTKGVKDPDLLPKDSFIVSLSCHPDFSKQAMSKVGDVLMRHSLCPATVQQDYQEFLKTVSSRVAHLLLFSPLLSSLLLSSVTVA